MGENRGRAQRAIFLRGPLFNQIWAYLLEITRGFFVRKHLNSKHASTQSKGAQSMCTRLPSPPPPSSRRRLHRRPFRRCPFRRRPFLHRLPCCRRLLTPLPPPLCPQPSSAAPALARLGSARSARLSPLSWAWLPTRSALDCRLGLDRIARLGSARLARLARLTRLLEHGGPPCTAAAARHALLSAWRSSAQLSSARLSSSRFVWLGLARLVQHDPHGSHLLGGAPCRRHLRAQPCVAQARRGAAALSKKWAVGRAGAALSLGDARCGAGESGLPH